MKPARTIFGKTRIPLAVVPRVLAAGVFLYREASAAWTSESTPAGDSAPADFGPLHAMRAVIRMNTVMTRRARRNMALSPSIDKSEGDPRPAHPAARKTDP